MLLLVELHSLLSSLFLEKGLDLLVFKSGARSKEAFPLLLGIDEEAAVELQQIAEVVHGGSLVGHVREHEELHVLRRRPDDFGVAPLKGSFESTAQASFLIGQGLVHVLDPDGVPAFQYPSSFKGLY